MTSTPTNPMTEIPLPSGRGSLIFRTTGTVLEFIDGRVIVHKGTVEKPGISAKADFAKALKTGDVIADGPNKGWIYCEGEDIEPFLVAHADSGVMNWHHAMVLVSRGQMELPTPEQLRAMYIARNTGALSGSFNVTGSVPSGWYWSSEQYNADAAWCQSFCIRSGMVDITKDSASAVRCVRQYTPA